MQRRRRPLTSAWIRLAILVLVASWSAACAEGTNTSSSGRGGGGTSTTGGTGGKSGGGGTGTAGMGTGGASGTTTTGGSTTGGSTTGGATTGGTSGAGGVVGGGGGSGGCGPTEKMCFNICVPADDPKFGCDDPACAPCSDAHALPGCVAGACALLKCDAEWADCDGDASDGCEVNLPIDPANCGACGVACVIPHGTPGCEAGACTVGACDAPWSDCNGVAADGCETNVQVDPANCNACGMPCAPGEQCEAGVCGVFCPPGKANCDGNAVNGCEVDLGTTADCAFCGDACMLSNASADCQVGACVVVACGPGFADCDMLADNGCEANLDSSAQTCGGCGQACPSGPNSTAVCAAGLCDLVCAGGYANCNGDPLDGCEQPTLTDPSNCGACNTTCVTPNATPGCAAGACKIASCNPGFADCDLVVADGCEINLGNDAAHCGACGTTCPTPPNASPNCAGGTCGFSCNVGFADCDGLALNGCEVDLQTDPSHCGSCAGACSVAHATPGCAAGSCTIASCDAGYKNCDGFTANGCEASLQTDPLNCGTCATVCNLPNSSQACSGGACVVGACNPPFANCDGLAANGCETNTDSSIPNCGACNQACTVANGAPACAAGQCLVSSCNAGFANCNGQVPDGCEINLNSNVSNCGGCGTVCALANASQSCVGGACAIASCDAGFANCDGQAVNGCEINLNSNAANCGSCGVACALANAGQSCVGGACAIGSCNAGFGDCDGQTPNGCETNLNASVGNCGACGNVCTFPNAGAGCSNGACAIGSCNAGFGNCDGQAANGCETNLDVSLGNCGACGNACNLANASSSCTNGACAVASCSGTFANCNNLAVDGCEVNLATSVPNCGACGNACNLANASQTCSAGACGIGSCNAGFANCDGQTATGCEVNLGTDVSNCGGCGSVCNLANASQTCSGGACGIGTCNAGFGNCDGQTVNGCEVNLNASVGNCGSCGNACSFANAGASCSNGSCAMGTCSGGFGNCDGQAANGCEINLDSSLANCGSCGNACNLANASATCSSGSCAVASCSGTFANCNAQSADGCEINLATNAANCGACGNVCNLPNAVAGCSAGGCTIASCAAGFADCDGLAANGCEVNTQTSVGNCGGCGQVCSPASSTGACVAGTCQVGTCNAGFANCNGLPVDGCEVNTQTSVGNCGGCGQICAPANSAGTCSSGACTIGSCNAGFSNCNGAQADGCEINLQADVQNCGVCGNNCAVTCSGNTSLTACSSGACGIQSCQSGYFNLDGLCSGGCECLASNVSQSCNTPASLGTLAVGAAPITTSANLVPAGVEGWYTVTFTGNTNPSYHPHVKLTVNPGGAFKFDIRTNCAGGTMACGVEGGVSNGLTDWETFNGAGSPGYYDAIAPVGNNGTVLIHVYRAAGQPVTCQSFTLQVSN